MKVFIAWSGERSKAVAEALRDWLPNVIQAIQPWLSAADIEKGARWSSDLADELEETQVGLICLTPGNLKAPWLLFEAGALSKTQEETYVCTYLLDVGPTDLEGPLAQFQATIANEEDTRKLVQTINRVLGDEALGDERVNTAFEKFWPDLEEALASIPAAEGQPEPQRSVEDMVEEILALVRALEREMVLDRRRQERVIGEFTLPSSGSLDVDAYVRRAIPTTSTISRATSPTPISTTRVSSPTTTTTLKTVPPDEQEGMDDQAQHFSAPSSAEQSVARTPKGA